MSYLKPVVVASAMLVASLPAFAGHINYAGAQESSPVANVLGVGRNSPVSDASGFNWEKRVFVSGLLNVDTLYSERGWASSDLTTYTSGAADFQVPPFQSTSVHGSDIIVNNANLFIDAKVNGATTAHVGVVYAQRPGESGAPYSFEESSSVFADLRDHSVNVPSFARFSVDEAYVLFHDCSSPFYFQAGKKFTSFSNYNPYPITYSLTQLLAQTDEEVLEFGYNGVEGAHASIYVFNGPFSGRVTNAHNFTSRISNYGLDFSYSSQYDNINYQLGAGYVKDIRDSSFLAHKIMNNVNLSPDALFADCENYIFSRAAGAYSLHADMSNGPLVLAADYVAAVKSIFDIGTSSLSTDINTRLWAYGVEAGYGFDSMGYASKASLGYQRSGNTSLLAMPRYRMLADYTVEVSKNAKVTLEYAHSRDHKASDIVAGNECWNFQDATNNTTNTVALRIGIAI